MRNDPKVSLSIGIFAHNEENNIKRAIKSVQRSLLNIIGIKKIYVISSGSFDKTNHIVRQEAKKDKRIVLISEVERRGKSAAINHFLSCAKTKVVVTMSADLRLSKNALEEIGLPFLNQEVGMVGAHPIPSNTRYSQIGQD